VRKNAASPVVVRKMELAADGLVWQGCRCNTAQRVRQARRDASYWAKASDLVRRSDRFPPNATRIDTGSEVLKPGIRPPERKTPPQHIGFSGARSHDPEQPIADRASGRANGHSAAFPEEEPVMERR